MISSRCFTHFALLLPLLLAGCSKPAPPDGNIVSIRAGQVFEYQSSGELNGNAVSGHVTHEYVQAEDEDGEPCLNQETTNLVEANGQKKTLHFTTYVRQDDKGSWYELGGSEDGWLKEPVLSTASPMMLGQTSKTTSNYSSGTTMTDEVEVTDIEQVTVPAGTYTAFVVENKHTSKRGELRIKDWWVPSVGRPVKTEMSNGTLDLTLELVKVGQAEE